jgi:hypothetical protein
MPPEIVVLIFSFINVETRTGVKTFESLRAASRTFLKIADALLLSAMQPKHEWFDRYTSSLRQALDRAWLTDDECRESRNALSKLRLLARDTERRHNHEPWSTLLDLHREGYAIECSAFSPSGRYVAMGDLVGNVSIIDIEKIKEASESGISPVELTRQGALFADSSRSIGQSSFCRVFQGERALVQSLTFSRDDTRLVVLYDHDGNEPWDSDFDSDTENVIEQDPGHGSQQVLNRADEQRHEQSVADDSRQHSQLNFDPGSLRNSANTHDTGLANGTEYRDEGFDYGEGISQVCAVVYDVEEIFRGMAGASRRIWLRSSNEGSKIAVDAHAHNLVFTRLEDTIAATEELLRVVDGGCQFPSSTWLYKRVSVPDFDDLEVAYDYNGNLVSGQAIVESQRIPGDFQGDRSLARRRGQFSVPFKLKTGGRRGVSPALSLHHAQRYRTWIEIDTVAGTDVLLIAQAWYDQEGQRQLRYKRSHISLRGLQDWSPVDWTEFETSPDQRFVLLQYPNTSLALLIDTAAPKIMFERK